MIRLSIPALLGASLTACATAQPGSAYPGGNSADRYVCRNTMLEQFVGQPATADLGLQIIRASGSKTLQWVAAGMMVTMEFRADRVRIYLDEQNKVQRVSCG
ncbi:I78 family peptidase inhibitor [Sphingomonas sp. LHG3406-1]|uniref:I78 family peptidase inhibitor n=1 Tax=Sphingomonas sp. LHG3406-1 TaxID=2804617 RepID=UPI00261C401F|nr:I78 family peptidase inhibitor [Sphingomonas sp. LHG3406-1]